MDINFGLKARHLANVNKWTALEKLCKEKLEMDPNEDFAIYYLCLSYQAKGKLTEALEILEPVYTNSNDFESLYADICLQLKRFKVAESIYEKLLSEDPQNDFNLAKLAKSKLALLQYEKAKELALESLKINPNNDEAIQVFYLANSFTDEEDLSHLSSLLDNLSLIHI